MVSVRVLYLGTDLVNMPRCFVCRKDLTDLANYHLHLSNEHKIKDGFSCAEGSCRRAYNSFNSLKKHLRASHAITSSKDSEPKSEPLLQKPNKSLEESVPSHEACNDVEIEVNVKKKFTIFFLHFVLIFIQKISHDVLWGLS